MPAQTLPQGIRAVLFDFDGTLRHNDPLAHHFFFNHAVELGAEDSPENRRDGLRWAHLYWNSKGGIVTDTEKYGYGSDEFWLNYANQYLQAFNCTDEQARDFAPKLNMYMAEQYTPSHRIEEDTPGLLTRLREMGYVLGVVSNRNEPFTELMDSLGLTPYFDFTLAAGEVESWKPDPEIFIHGIELAGTRPEESLYIGDNYFADIVGARKAGLHPVLYDPEKVFPEADCVVIDSLALLPNLLIADLS